MRAEDLTEEKIVELKQKHGQELSCIPAPNGDVIVVHRPDKPVWSRFMKHIADDKRDRADTIRQFAASCIAAPSVDEANKLFDTYPVFPTVVSDELTKLGGGGEVEVKKL
jgi:hypothetical protein